jgi:hypothetical protein
MWRIHIRVAQKVPLSLSRFLHHLQPFSGDPKREALTHVVEMFDGGNL